MGEGKEEEEEEEGRGRGGENDLQDYLDYTILQAIALQLQYV